MISIRHREDTIYYLNVMFFTAPLIIIAAISSVHAHSKIDIVYGNLGGNGTALGILGGIVPHTGRNNDTQVDATVFPKPLNIKVNGLGVTGGGKRLKPEDLELSLVLSGSTLPRVSNDGNGTISGTYRVVTGDGAGPIFAVIDTSARGVFAKGVEAKILTNVPGNKGRIRAGGYVPYSFPPKLRKRAPNVNLKYPFTIAIPIGTQCSGKVAGKEGVCFMKVSNLNKNGPFGGVIAFQVKGNGTDF